MTAGAVVSDCAKDILPLPNLEQHLEPKATFATVPGPGFFAEVRGLLVLCLHMFYRYYNNLQFLDWKKNKFRIHINPKLVLPLVLSLWSHRRILYLTQVIADDGKNYFQASLGVWNEDP